MNNIVTTTQTRWDHENRILYIDFVGHITKAEMISILNSVETALETISQKPVRALHNFKRTTHISLDAQIIFSERTQTPLFCKHAFVSNSDHITETIDIMISIMQDSVDSMKIFPDEPEAEQWLIQ
jgi:hypothetical protein